MSKNVFGDLSGSPSSLPGDQLLMYRWEIPHYLIQWEYKHRLASVVMDLPLHWNGEAVTFVITYPIFCLADMVCMFSPKITVPSFHWHHCSMIKR